MITMFAYKLCDVEYRFQSMDREMQTGRGTLWLSPNSILIKSKKWWYVPCTHIKHMWEERGKIEIHLENDLRVEMVSKNKYVMKALYHFLEGVRCQRRA